MYKCVNALWRSHTFRRRGIASQLVNRRFVFQTNCNDFESRLNTECDAIVSAVRRRQQQLIANARNEKTFRQQAYRDQVAQCTSKVHRTTGLLQYSVEVMKEADQTAFLQVPFRALSLYCFEKCSLVAKKASDLWRNFGRSNRQTFPGFNGFFYSVLNTETMGRLNNKHPVGREGPGGLKMSIHAHLFRRTI